MMIRETGLTKWRRMTDWWGGNVGARDGQWWGARKGGEGINAGLPSINIMWVRWSFVLCGVMWANNTCAPGHSRPLRAVGTRWAGGQVSLPLSRYHYPILPPLTAVGFSVYRTIQGKPPSLKNGHWGQLSSRRDSDRNVGGERITHFLFTCNPMPRLWNLMMSLLSTCLDSVSVI